MAALIRAPRRYDVVFPKDRQAGACPDVSVCEVAGAGRSQTVSSPSRPREISAEKRTINPNTSPQNANTPRTPRTSPNDMAFPLLMALSLRAAEQLPGMCLYCIPLTTHNTARYTLVTTIHRINASSPGANACITDANLVRRRVYSAGEYVHIASGCRSVMQLDEPPSLSPATPVSFRRDASVPDRVFLALFVVLALCHLAAAWLALGWVTAVVTDLVFLGYLAAAAGRPRWRPLIARLLLLGLVAGMLELATDAAGAQFAHSLVYPAGEPMLWQSPVYMPISWMVVLTLLGYLGWRLAGRLPLWQAMALSALAGMLTVPFYEECAWYAGWWRYTNLPRIGHTPIYVFLFEGAVAMILPLLTRRIERLSLARVATLGLVLGGWMPLVAFVSWRLLGQG